MKSIQKSIRLSDKSYNYIMSLPGASFSEKLDYIVSQYTKILPELQEFITAKKKYIAILDERIKQKEVLIVKLNIIEKHIMELMENCNT